MPLRLARLVGVLFGMLLATLADAGAGQQEDEVKAAFIYHFVKFVEWPVAALPNGEFRVCLLGGSESLFSALKAIQGKEVHQGHGVVVRRLSKDDTLSACQALVIGEHAGRPLSTILEETGGRPILTIADLDGFIDVGGMIGLLTVERRVRFEISTEPAQRSHLQVSAQLLKLARRVRR